MYDTMEGIVVIIGHFIARRAVTFQPLEFACHPVVKLSTDGLLSRVDVNLDDAGNVFHTFCSIQRRSGIDIRHGLLLFVIEEF